MLERRVRTAKYLVFRTRENPWKQRETGGRKSLSRGGFRVVLVMTSSIALRISQLFSVRWENARKTRKNNMKLWNPNPRKALYGGHFQRTKRPELPKISSAAPSTTRTTLRIYFHPCFLPKNCSKIRWGENRRESKKYSILRFSVLRNIKEKRGDEIHRFRRNFKSASLRPLRYISMLYFQGFAGFCPAQSRA